MMSLLARINLMCACQSSLVRVENCPAVNVLALIVEKRAELALAVV